VSGAFLIVFDALSIIIIIIIIIFKICASTFIYTTLSETQHRLCTISDCWVVSSGSSIPVALISDEPSLSEAR